MVDMLDIVEKANAVNPFEYTTLQLFNFYVKTLKNSIHIHLMFGKDFLLCGLSYTLM